MIFQQTLEQGLSGKKSQTRRHIKPDKKFIYQAGKTYAVQPRRAQSAVARFEVTAKYLPANISSFGKKRQNSPLPPEDTFFHARSARVNLKINRDILIRKQRLGEITHEKALAEGFAGVADYQKLWLKLYGNFNPSEEVWVIGFKVLPHTKH